MQLYDYIRFRGLTVAAASRDMGIVRTTLVRHMTGERRPTASEIERYRIWSNDQVGVDDWHKLRLAHEEGKPLPFLEPLPPRRRLVATG